jgi:hypothetical protein
MAGLSDPGRAEPFPSRIAMIASGNSDPAQMSVCFRYGRELR